MRPRLLPPSHTCHAPSNDGRLRGILFAVPAMTHTSDFAIAGLACPDGGKCEICMGDRLLQANQCVSHSICNPNTTTTITPGAHDHEAAACNLTLLNTQRHIPNVTTAALEVTVCYLDVRNATPPPGYVYNMTTLPHGWVGRMCKPAVNGGNNGTVGAVEDGSSGTSGGAAAASMFGLLMIAALTATLLRNWRDRRKGGAKLRGVLRQVEERDQVIALKQDEVVRWQSAFQIHEDEVVMTGKMDEGAFGEVWNGHWMDSDCAIKVPKTVDDGFTSILDTLAQDDFVQEAILVCKIRHQNVITMFGVCAIPPTPIPPLSPFPSPFSLNRHPQMPQPPGAVRLEGCRASTLPRLMHAAPAAPAAPRPPYRGVLRVCSTGSLKTLACHLSSWSGCRRALCGDC